MTRQSSVEIAKDRLKILVTSDRVECTSESYERICSELKKLLSKHIKIDSDVFEISITRTHVHIKIAGE